MVYSKEYGFHRSLESAYGISSNKKQFELWLYDFLKSYKIFLEPKVRCRRKYWYGLRRITVICHYSKQRLIIGIKHPFSLWAVSTVCLKHSQGVEEGIGRWAFPGELTPVWCLESETELRKTYSGLHSWWIVLKLEFDLEFVWLRDSWSLKRSVSGKGLLESVK